MLDRTGALTQVLVETATNGSPIAFYVYGLGLAERITPEGTVTTYHFDIRGSTVALSDAARNVTDAYAFDSFGVLASTDGNSPQPFRYLGRYGIIDDGNGLYQARARYFNPQLGRFLTKDPITGKDSDGQSLNRYVYVLNNPILLIDPTGLTTRDGNFHQYGAYDPAAGEAAYWDAFFKSFDSSWGYKVLVVTEWAGIAASFALEVGPVIAEARAAYALSRGSTALQGIGNASSRVRPTGQSGTANQNLFHYTNEEGLQGILQSGELRASLKAVNPNDVRYGNGQYLSNIVPGSKTPAQLSREFLTIPWQAEKFTRFLEIDVSGLKTIEGRPGVFVIPNEGPLDLTGRIISSGIVPNP